MEVTIKDVAKLAGVSVATVSRVLNNSAIVSPETTKSVGEAIKALNYRPNFLGRNLRKRETNVILALIPSTEQTYYSEILHGMQVKAADYGYDIFMSVTNSYLQLEEKLLGLLYNRIVDGAILMGTKLDRERINEISKTDYIALCCEEVEGAEVPTVIIDNEQAAFDAVRYLISMGHRRIGMVSTDVRAPSSVAREAGYMRALEESGIPFDEDYLFRGSYDFSSGGDALEKFMKLEKKPTGIFAISDFLAAGVVKKAHSFGLKIGKEFSVIGFDNITMAEVYTPSISTVEQPCFQMGVKVAETLIENMNGHKHSGKIIMPHRLVLRETTEDKTV